MFQRPALRYCDLKEVEYHCISLRLPRSVAMMEVSWCNHITFHFNFYTIIIYIIDFHIKKKTVAAVVAASTYTILTQVTRWYIVGKKIVKCYSIQFPALSTAHFYTQQQKMNKLEY